MKANIQALNRKEFTMKKLITTLLLVSTLASVLQLTACKNNENSPENPFAVDGLSPDPNKNNQLSINSKTGWTADNPHGEKIMYGKGTNGSILRFNDMMIGLSNYGSCYGYFSFEEPNDTKLICFDPLCLHLPQQESCPAIINHSRDNPNQIYYESYPSGMYLDLYENSESPVIYYFYRRDSFYTINIEEVGHRDPVYCIERYDLSQGKRYAVVDDLENTILQACNYGDYVYYVLDMGDDKGQELYRVHKSGTKPEKYDRTEIAESLRIADVIDDKFYYIVDERCIFQANLDLTDSKMILDMASVKGENDSNGVIEGVYSGYLYYFADVETVWADTYTDQKANLYRIPMSDLEKTPEKVAENVLYSGDCYRFTEKTLYYEPCVHKIDNSEGGHTLINTCDGKLFALDLKTGESKTIVEDSGMTIYPLYAWDDMVVFAGWAYTESGVKNAGNNDNLLVAYASGEPYEIWCKKAEPGSVTEEYLAELRAVTDAAREEYESKQNAK